MNNGMGDGGGEAGRRGGMHQANENGCGKKAAKSDQAKQGKGK